MRLWAHHATAHGADAVLYFRWRRCRQGQEQYHAGLRKQDGSPDRGYEDATVAAEELSAVDRAVDDGLDHVDAPVALLHDYDDWWAVSAQPHAPEFDYWEHLRTYYRGLRERGVQVDVVHPESDLSTYEAVVAPTLHLASEDRAAHLTEFVEAGGELLLGARSGAKDPYNQLHEDLAPGPFADLAGLSVDQHESFPADVDRSVRLGDGFGGDSTAADADVDTGPDPGSPLAWSVWGEWLDVDDADVIAVHDDGGVSGDRPAVARNEVGSGSVTYCGVWPDGDLAAILVDDVLARAGVATTARLPRGVRVNRRGDVTWVSNFTNDAYRVVLDRDDADPVDASAFVVGDAELGAFDAVAVAASPSGLDVVRRE